MEPAIASNQVDVALAACADGLGLGQFLCYQVSAAIAAGTLVRVLASHEPAAVPVQVIYPGTRRLSANVRALVDSLAPRLRKSLAAGSVQ